ncbi:MAG: hypothetical protein LUG18_02430 [Candidatus Azobacteroides sp.]|nr:hypothetical protein [Candidatus Azobacteroides sp.]
MKNLKSDFLFVLVVLAIFLPFIVLPSAFDWYITTNRSHPLLLAFIKFAILATMGEMFGLRIKTGHYTAPAFGIIPRAVIWGLLGVWIAIAMKIFAMGTPIFMEGMGFQSMTKIMQDPFTLSKLFGAFCISVGLNTCYAPVFMTVHKVTDTHIMQHQGNIKALFTPIRFGNILSNLDWKVQWGFVFKKTIPFFWIPAHTFTFSLPGDFQVLTAALLSIALGLILSIASLKSKK